LLLLLLLLNFVSTPTDFGRTQTFFSTKPAYGGTYARTKCRPSEFLFVRIEFDRASKL